MPNLIVVSSAISILFMLWGGGLPPPNGGFTMRPNSGGEERSMTQKTIRRQSVSRLTVLIETVGLVDAGLPEVCANLAFGGPKRDRLFITASQSLYVLRVATQGAAPG